MIDNFTKLNTQGVLEQAQALQPGDNVSSLVNDAGYVTGSSAIFGQGFEDFSTDSAVLFNTNTYIKGYDFLTTSKSAGRYRVKVHLVYESDDDGKFNFFQLRINGTPIGLEVVTIGRKKDFTRHPVELLGYFDLNSAGTFNIEVWVKQEDNKDSTLRGAVAEVWRVS
jgi:hypothetical protein